MKIIQTALFADEQKKLLPLVMKLIFLLTLSLFMKEASAKNYFTNNSATKNNSFFDRIVKGKVTNAKGENIANATVIEKGTKNATTTNEYGDYEINVTNDNAILLISYVGYETKETPVGTKGDVNITLKDKDSKLGEVVVVGYGSVQRKNLTTAVTTVSGKDIKEQPISTFQQALQGKVAGVQVTQPSGKPGEDVKIVIRNASSINATNDPLYVIDGVISISTNGINPADIENVQILKDAAAQSVYGSRAANGVIIITTKRGKTGKLEVNFSQQTGYTEIVKKLDLLNSTDYLKIVNEGLINSGQPTLSPSLSTVKANTNWQDEVFGRVQFTNSQLSFGAGTEKYNYYVSLGYLKQSGIINPSDFSRYNFRINQDYKISKVFTVGTNFGLSRVVRADNVRDEYGAGPNVVNLTFKTSPNIPVQNASGAYVRDIYNNASSNPIFFIKQGNNRFYENKYLRNFFAEAKLPYNLKFRTSFGVDASNFSQESNTNPEVRQDDNRFQQIGKGFDSQNEFIYNWDNTLTYNGKFLENQKVEAVVGHSAQHSDYLSGGDRGEWAYDSYFARANYSFADKYLLSGTIRREGSSRFGPNNRVAYFPSASIAWRVTDENFMQKIKLITDLKFRVSYGKTGNSNGIGDFSYLGTVANGPGYLFDNTRLQGIYQTRLDNFNLGWEKISQSNFGMDISLLYGKLSITTDYYFKKTTDLLLEKNIPTISGLDRATLNTGQLSSKGFEFTMNTKNVETKNFTWTTQLVFTTAKVTVDKLADNQPLPKGEVSNFASSILIEEGKPLGNFYGYVSLGVNPQTGDLMYKDVNNNGVSNVGENFDPGDRTVIGNALPDFTAGVTNTVIYKNFDLNFSFDGVFGNDIFNANRIETEGLNQPYNQTTNVLRRWTTKGQVTDIPRPLYGQFRNTQISTRFIEKGDFVKLRNLTIGYTLNKVPAKIAFLKGARIYAGARNLLTFTNYSGLDPEISTLRNRNSSGVENGIDFGAYPQIKTFTLGLNIRF